MQGDLVDNFWALIGRAVHHILETGSPEEVIVEERLFAKCRDWTLSGQMDAITIKDGTAEIQDYKVTKAMSVNYNKIDWETQLNSYAWLVRQSLNIPVTKLSVLAVYRDWDEFEKMRVVKSGAKYPEGPMQVVPVALWSDHRQNNYIDERIALHQAAEQAQDVGDPLPPCTAEERWEKQGWHKITKPNAKRALRVFATEEEAKAHFTENNIKAPYEIQFFEGGSIRCERDFCRVSNWCSQFKEMQDD